MSALTPLPLSRSPPKLGGTEGGGEEEGAQGGEGEGLL